MKTLKDYKKYLTSLGFTETLSEEYDSNRWNTVYSIDQSKDIIITSEGYGDDSIVDEVFIEGPVNSSPRDADYYNSYDKTGIVLSFYSKSHGLGKLKECINIQTSRLLEHEIKIIGCHLKNLEWVQSRLDPVLSGFDFNVVDSKFFDCSSYSWEGFEGKLVIQYSHVSGNSDIFIGTDTFTGELVIEGIKEDSDTILGMSQNELNNLIIREIMFNPEKYTFKEDFEYLFDSDPKNTKHTSRELNKIFYGTCDLNRDRKPDYTPAEIDLNHIPDNKMYLFEDFKKKYDAYIQTGV